MRIQKGTYNGLESYSEVINQLDFENKETIDFEFFTIGSSSKQIPSPDSLQFNESESNFSNAISQIQELEDDFDASIILSDGIITFGRNPSIQAANLSIPLYSIALGDTSKVRDITISNIVSNPNGFTDTRHLVEVEVIQNGFLGESVTLELRNSSGELIDSNEIQFNSSESIQSTTFEIDLTEPGLKQFTIEISETEGEWSTENNTGTISIDVSESKTKILHLAFEIHPDVKMLRSLLSEDQNIELLTLTWLGGSRFVEDDLPELEEQDLLIFHGLPRPGFDTDLLDDFNLIPTLYFQLPKTRALRTGPLSELNLIHNTGNQLFELTLFPATESTDHPVMELPEIGFQNVSPIISSLRSVSTIPDGIELFKSGFQGIETPNTIINVNERGSMRRATVSAWGWYRMYQSPIENERAFVTQLFSNLTTWTANDPDERRLRVTPSKPVFNISEQVIINGNLNNESGEPEAEATIEFTLIPENGEERTSNMSNEGNGNYKFESQSLSSGLYSFTATARKGGREIDSQTGEFLVQDSNSELVNTLRNDELLLTIANGTGGSFFEYTRLEDFWTTLNSDDILGQKEDVIEAYTFPVRSLFWFVLVIFLLGTEWIGRKYYSLP
ncbi:MAG: hypothetical protein JJ971_11170 [Balneolaceae bacterium]|nr:hypothetical protein [Balneolaceae bacterium]MBO6546191.1 hypothetical protein [Balneolaceae bacterium]MBO6648550.1 hypothetical protein [Balneolaceae bacterium]